METKKCGECGTENGTDFIYCKNCGALLRQPANAAAGHADAFGGQSVGAESKGGFGDSAAQPPGGAETFSHSDAADAQNTQSAEQAQGADSVSEQPQNSESGGPFRNSGSQAGSNDDGGIAQNDSFTQNDGFAQTGSINGGAAQNINDTQNYGTEQPQYGYGGEHNYGQYGYSPYGSYSSAICGLPAEDVAAYVGMKAPVIIPKFSQMSATRSKTSWCGPAFTLGLLFGPLGAAIWFFYRKVNKVAFLLFAIGAAAAMVNYAIAYSGGISPYADGYTTAQMISAAFNLVLRIVTSIWVGLYAMYYYLDDAVGKIHSFMHSGYDSRYYKIGLSSIGGSSGGMAVLGVFLMFAVYWILEIVLQILIALP